VSAVDYPGVYLPFKPLEELMVARLDGHRACGRYDDHYDQRLVHAQDLAEKVGVSRRTWERWKAADRVPWGMADHAAISAGEHPVLIWPDFHSAVE
jgi:hypothetical protein